MILNQLARRNLAPEQQSYLRGLLYEAVPKSKGGRPKENSGQSDPGSDTAEIIAKQTGVSPATVKRDAKFARAVDAIGSVAPDVKRDILAGKAKATRQEVVKAAVRSGPEEPRQATARHFLSK